MNERISTEHFNPKDISEKISKIYNITPEDYWKEKVKKEFPNLSVKPREGYTYENLYEAINHWGIGQILTNNVKISDVSSALLFSLVKPKPWYIVIITKSDIEIFIVVASDIDIVYNNRKWQEFRYDDRDSALRRGLIRYGSNYSSYGLGKPKIYAEYNNNFQVMEQLNQLTAQGYYIMTRSLSLFEYEELNKSGKVQRTFQRFIIKDMTEETYNELIRTNKIVNSSYAPDEFKMGYSLFYEYAIDGKYIQFR